MIALLTGTLHSKATDLVIVDVQGVGYSVMISAHTYKSLPSCGDRVALHIHTHVREDQISLFGFSTTDEKAIFLRLLSVSGIGPRLALGILSGLSPTDIVSVVSREDIDRLKAIPGVGKKTAERIMVDLRDKFLKEFPMLVAHSPKTSTIVPSTPAHDAISALVNLGYPRPIAENAVMALAIEEGVSIQHIIKRALKEIKPI